MAPHSVILSEAEGIHLVILSEAEGIYFVILSEAEGEVEESQINQYHFYIEGGFTFGI